jgi:hypothetical protein
MKLMAGMSTLYYPGWSQVRRAARRHCLLRLQISIEVALDPQRGDAAGPPRIRGGDRCGLIENAAPGERRNLPASRYRAARRSNGRHPS